MIGHGAFAAHYPMAAPHPQYGHGRYQAYGLPGGHYAAPPPPQGCSFCAKANNRRDDFGLTHRVKDECGNVTCPFLKIVTCTRCYTKGHTPAFCPNPPADQEFLIDDIMSISINQNKAQREETEEEFVQRRKDEEDRELRYFRYRLAKAEFGAPRECSFCKNGKYQDDYFKTHNVDVCPRLACTRCPYCKKLGHTLRYCKLRQHNEAMRAGGGASCSKDVEPPPDCVSSCDSSGCTFTLTSKFIFDFDAEGEDSCSGEISSRPLLSALSASVGSVSMIVEEDDAELTMAD
jgi:hypothetical protein